MRASYTSQQCTCGRNGRCHVSVTMAGSTLGVNPRRKSRAITVYVCRPCLKKPASKTRKNIIAAVLQSASGALKVVRVAKGSRRRAKSAHR